MALTVGVATVLDSKEVVVVVTGQRKALALSKAIGKFISFGFELFAFLDRDCHHNRGGSQPSSTSKTLVIVGLNQLMDLPLLIVDLVCPSNAPVGSHCG